MIVNIYGGLGNQMFQYAFGYALSSKLNKTLLVNLSNFDSYHLRSYELDKFNIDVNVATKDQVNQLKFDSENIANKLARKILRKPLKKAQTYFSEPHFQFTESVFNFKGCGYFEGYWQSEKYFADYRVDLLNEYTLKTPLSSESSVFQKKILSNEAISLHIRRGDYVSDTKTNSVHGTCSLEYYINAIDFFSKKFESPHFFVFSDDLQWAQENLTAINYDITFVGLNSRAISDHEEMILMSFCKHHIIANSSFSWWGAWLNNKPNKIVIAPKKWFKDESIDTSDLIPESWIRL